MRAKEDSIGLNKTPKMVRKKNGTLFCFLIPNSHNSIALWICAAVPFIILPLSYIYDIPILSESTFLVIAILMGLSLLTF